MKRSPKKKIEKTKKGTTGEFLSVASNRSDLNPNHRRDFNQLLDDMVPPAPVKKK